MALTRTSCLLGCGSFLLVVGLVASCTSLEDIELGVCGNSVLDPGEDCDGHEKNGVACGEPGTTNACRYLCDFASDAPVCPDADYRCGASGVCARAGTGFVAGAELSLGGEAVVVADFDGDKVDDIGVANSVVRELTVSFLGAGTGVDLEQRVPINGSTIAAAHLRGGVRADLVVASEGSLVSFSTPASERMLVNNASTLIAVDVTRLIGVPARALAGEAAKLALEPDTVLGGVLISDGSIYYQNPFTLSPSELVSIGSPVAQADLVGFFKARFYPVPDGEDPCDELIVVRGDTRELTVIQMCSEGEPTLLNTACAGCLQSVELDGPPLAAFSLNLDADPELEIVVVERQGDVTSLETFEAGGVAPAFVPGLSAVDAQMWLDALLASTPDAEATILSIAFINDDADLDFVRSDGVYLSERLFADPEVPPSYFRAATPSAGEWREALVGDFGGDQRIDVVATTGLVGDGLELRIGTSSSYLNGVTIATDGAVAQLRAGDFDGDGTADVVFRERSDNDGTPVPACEVVDSVVVRFGARDLNVLADARVLSRVSGVEDIVAGPLPRFDTRDSISDFATASRCDASPLGADISLFYGAVNRQILAPKVLLDNRDVGTGEQVIVPYTPVVVAPFPDSPFVATLGEDRFKAVPGTADDVALFVLSPDEGVVSGLLEGQHISLLGEGSHENVAPTELRVAIVRLEDPETPAVLVVDSLHIHIIREWADLPDASDKTNHQTIESFPFVDMPGGGDGFAVDTALGGDVTGDGIDDLVIAGRLDGEPILRIHSRLSDDPAAFTDLSGIEGLGSAVLAVALLPREDLPASQVSSVDLVVALENRGAAVVRYDGTSFTVVAQLPLEGITTLAVGDVDGDQFADVVLVASDLVRVFARTQRYAGDVAISSEAGEE